MGKTVRRKRRNKGLTRREFVQRAGFAAAAVPLLPGCGSSSSQDRGASAAPLVTAFKHGVASGDPLADRVILWSRVTPERDGEISGVVEVFDDAGLTQLVGREAFTTSAERDYTVKLDFTGLQPGRTYYYQFSAADAKSPVGRTKTAAAGPVANLRFALVNCSDFSFGFFIPYRTLARRLDLDAVIHLGDYIYEHAEGPEGFFGQLLDRPHDPPHETITLDDYRRRYAQYRGDPDLQELHRLNPFICIWDDHEFANNAYRDGAVNHTEDEEGAWTDRRQAATRAYFEWIPIRSQPEDPERRIYRKLSYGELADVILLDTRIEGRDKQDPAARADPNHHIISEAQLQFLQRSLGESSATWKILAQQVILSPFISGDSPSLAIPPQIGVESSDLWQGYKADRARIFQFLRDRNIQNLIVAAGDVHTSHAFDLSDDPTNLAVYNPVTGDGSLGVELVPASVTSLGFPVVETVATLINPHQKWVESTLQLHGYVLLELAADAANAQFWYVSSIFSAAADGEFPGPSFRIAAGANRLGPISLG